MIQDIDGSFTRCNRYANNSFYNTRFDSLIMIQVIDCAKPFEESK